MIVLMDFPADWKDSLYGVPESWNKQQRKGNKFKKWAGRCTCVALRENGLEFGGVAAINAEDDVVWFESRAHKNCKKRTLALFWALGERADDLRRR